METTSQARAIDYLALDDVAATTRNPKGHDLPAIVVSIARFGLTSPMVRDERTGELVIGNGRRHALNVIRDHLDGKPAPEVPDVTWREVDRYLQGHPPGGVEVTDGEWRVPVVTGWASHDDEHASAVVITDNRLTEKGGWDERSLAELLEEIADGDPDLLTITGYSVDDLDDLLADHAEDRITMPVGETGARWAETDEQFAERAQVTTAYTDRHASGALIELILVFPLADHTEVTRLIRIARDRDGDRPAAAIVLDALRAHIPDPDRDDGDGEDEDEDDDEADGDLDGDDA